MPAWAMLKCAFLLLKRFYAIYTCEFGEAAATRPIDQARAKLLLLRRTIKTRASPRPEAVAYMTKAFRYPIMAACRLISFATLARPATVPKSQPPVMPGIE